jgi:hypothetical protein
MGACELESGDVALAAIPIRKMTIGIAHQRERLVEYAAAHIQHMQKALMEARRRPSVGTVALPTLRVSLASSEPTTASEAAA